MLLRSVCSRATRAMRATRAISVCARTGATHARLHEPGEADALAGALSSLTPPADVVAINAEVEAATAGTPPLDVLDDAVAARTARAAIYEHEPRRADKAIPGLEPGSLVELAIFSPPEETEVAGMYVHFHGGGWVVGSAYGQSDARLQRMADELSCVVVSVDYRLAPEHTYPAAVDDAAMALWWAAEVGAEEYGAPALVAGGESSGAQVLLAALLRCPKEIRRRYRALNLVYGFYDLVGTRSRLGFDRRLVFCSSELAWFARLFCPEHLWPAASPLRAHLPQDLPPAARKAMCRDVSSTRVRWKSPRPRPSRIGDLGPAQLSG